MRSIKNSFLSGFVKTAGLPNWLHEMQEGKPKSNIKGESKKNLKGLLKRRGVVVGGLLG